MQRYACATNLSRHKTNCNRILTASDAIVIYKSEDGLVKIEAMVDPVNETIWANQKAIAALFDVTVPNISYHFKKIFESGELDAGTVDKDFLITAQSGARGTFDEMDTMVKVVLSLINRKN